MLWKSFARVRNVSGIKVHLFTNPFEKEAFFSEPCVKEFYAMKCCSIHAPQSPLFHLFLTGIFLMRKDACHVPPTTAPKVFICTTSISFGATLCRTDQFQVPYHRP